jgi:hypothetical protein
MATTVKSKRRTTQDDENMIQIQVSKVDDNGKSIQTSLFDHFQDQDHQIPMLSPDILAVVAKSSAEAGHVAGALGDQLSTTWKQIHSQHTEHPPGNAGGREVWRSHKGCKPSLFHSFFSDMLQILYGSTMAKYISSCRVLFLA